MVAMLDLLRERLGACGLDLVHPFDTAWYNPKVEPEYRLPTFGRERALGVLIGSTRAIWPPFMAECRDGSNPLDTWVEARIREASASLPVAWEAFFPPEPPPRRLPFQRLASHTGFAWLSPSWLLVDPEHGPWIALRGALVLDEDGPGSDAVLAADPCGGCPAGCKPAFDRALEGGDWRAWLAVRDACPVGRDRRYSEHEIRYHYTRDVPGLDYQPWWCEENVWRLSQRSRHAGSAAIFVSNAHRQVALWSQRAGRPGDGLCVWDYHVVLLSDGCIWDPDCSLGAPLPLESWLEASFPHGDAVPPRFQPRFRVVPRADFHRVFASDRSHMRAEDGSWLQKPPPWPRIGDGMTLFDLVGTVAPGAGDCCDLSALPATSARLLAASSPEE